MQKAGLVELNDDDRAVPIEIAFSKLKAHLRKAAERTIHGLWNAIGRIIDLYSSQKCANYFAAAGYDAT